LVRSTVTTNQPSAVGCDGARLPRTPDRVIRITSESFVTAGPFVVISTKAKGRVEKSGCVWALRQIRSRIPRLRCAPLGMTNADPPGAIGQGRAAKSPVIAGVSLAWHVLTTPAKADSSDTTLSFLRRQESRHRTHRGYPRVSARSWFGCRLAPCLRRGDRLTPIEAMLAAADHALMLLDGLRGAAATPDGTARHGCHNFPVPFSFLSQNGVGRHYIARTQVLGVFSRCPMTETDKYYVGRCLDGHPDDFRHLVRRYQPVLLAHLAGKLGNRDRAEEAAQ
jgi:hypothetical protein